MLPINVLVVCTGNICRSPMDMGLRRHRVDERGVESRVLSAGLITEGRAPSAHGVDAMVRRGIDVASHRSQRISAPLIAGADLIVGMERRHVREVAGTDPDAFPRTFTLPELARRARDLGKRSDDETPAEWIERAGGGRRASDFLHEDPADEVEDPIGLSAGRYEQTAIELEGLVDTIVDHLFPL